MCQKRVVTPFRQQVVISETLVVSQRPVRPIRAQVEAPVADIGRLQREVQALLAFARHAFGDAQRMRVLFRPGDVDVHDHGAGLTIELDRRGQHAKPPWLARRVTGIVEDELGQLAPQHGSDTRGGVTRLDRFLPGGSIAHGEIIVADAELECGERIRHAEASPCVVHVEHHATRVEDGHVRR